MKNDAELHHPITQHMQPNVCVHKASETVADLLLRVREHGLAERAMYFYVVDDENRLTGVVPVRRVLVNAPETLIGDIMVKRLVMVPDTATVADACDMFVLHKFLALPVVDSERRVVGVVDVSIFQEEMLDLAEQQSFDELYQVLGVRLANEQGASSFGAVRLRFPSLIFTIASGSACAFIASMFEQTLARTVILAMFLTMVLGLGESVSVQSMTLALQRLQARLTTANDALALVIREMSIAGMLGVLCGSVVSGLVLLWGGSMLIAGSVGISVFLALINAGFVGIAVPLALHLRQRDPRVAAGPIVLALADVGTLSIYFTAAWLATNMIGG